MQSALLVCLGCKSHRLQLHTLQYIIIIINNQKSIQCFIKSVDKQMLPRQMSSLIRAYSVSYTIDGIFSGDYTICGYTVQTFCTNLVKNMKIPSNTMALYSLPHPLLTCSSLLYIISASKALNRANVMHVTRLHCSFKSGLR